MALPAGFAAIDFNRFHDEALPALLTAGRAEFAARAAAGLSSIALRVPAGTAYTYRVGENGIDVTRGDDGADTVIEMDLDAWQGLVHELEAPAGLLYAGRVRCVRGNAVDLMAWESALRALYNGRPPYDPTTQALHDRSGRVLDPQATFSPASDRDEMAHFLRTAGYLFVRDVFRAEELETFLDEARQLQREARQGDKLSWWGKTPAGNEVLCRVTRGVAKPQLATLPTDPRLLNLKDLADESFVYRKGEGQGVTVIFKNPDVTEGLGDLPWHRDCGMGGHAVVCPTLVISVYLTDATPQTGELAMLPGSHQAAFNAHDPRRDITAYAAHFRARPGDVSLHFSDTVHSAPPPRADQRDGYRISAIVSFARPDARHHRGESSYNDVLHQRADGQIEHLETVAKRM
ncbi:MAG: phytanoyl-CoA dioxygenase family protein [Deltaproteobacteria bacterium]|nr:phytanoyl-CoA dioxygenase family protein [Deltaproteobacteria bacterium]MBI3386517.1 phytanoyl-CoA dioxygenase family protein [Deltaproteobacteria bacterium]